MHDIPVFTILIAIHFYNNKTDTNLNYNVDNNVLHVSCDVHHLIPDKTGEIHYPAIV